jgi:predicted Zn-dependent protease
MPAATGVARVNTSKGAMDVRLVAIRGAPDRIWRFIFLSRPSSTLGLQENFKQTAYSFRRLSAEEAAAAKPLQIDVVPVQASDTADTFAKRMTVDSYPLETFRVLNGLDAGERLQSGKEVKIVVE